MNQKLNFYQCIQLLSALAEKEIIQRDPENKNNILVYRSAGTEYPEGFYSQNLLSTASELVDDEEGQVIWSASWKKQLESLLISMQTHFGRGSVCDAKLFRRTKRCVFQMIGDMKASDFGTQNFLTHLLDDTIILDTEMLDENTIRLHMGHKTKYGELLVQKGDAVCGFYHKNKENGKGVSATMDISLHEDLHKNAVMADIFCLQAGRFQIESFIQADEYGANFSSERIWANDEKEPSLTPMPQLFVDGQFSKGFYNFVSGHRWRSKKSNADMLL